MRTYVAVLVLGLLAACTGSETPPPSATHSTRAAPDPSSAPPLTTYYDQKVVWQGCRDGFQCASVRVPVDYDKPTGPTIELSVVRLRARGSDRLGSLLVNPGGPGASGVAYARAAESVITAGVRQRYDIVGFDPRGVGASAPVHCLTDAQTDVWTSEDRSPDDAAEEAAVMASGRRLGKRCLAGNAELLAHVGTRDAARDLDVLRAVLGDDKLNLLGKSYGTYLGLVYAELFPRRVGRIVLDGVVDPAVDTAELARSQALGFEQALAAFVDDCLQRPSCPLTGDRGHALAQVSDILAAADREPLRAERPVTQSLALIGVAYAMYQPGLWQVLREALSQARSGSGSTLLLLADNYFERGSKGYRSNGLDAYYAIFCLDWPQTSDVAALHARAKALTAVAPRFGAYVAWETATCGTWPARAVRRAGPVRATGADPILVVGTTRDPATPYAFAKNVAAELDTARLLTYDGDGHTAYREGSGCIDAAVDAYLVAGTLPAEGARCR